MKLSLKTSSLFAAVAMSIYCMFAILAQTEFYSNVILAIDKYFVLSYVCSTLLFLSIAVFGLTLFVNRQQLPRLSKSLLWQAWIIVGILLFALIFNILGNTIVIHGLPYFAWYRFEWLRYIMLLLITAWLWQFAYIKPEEYLSTKPLGKCGLAVSIGVGVVLLLMFISLVHVLFTGHVAGFRTNVLVSWLKPISALLFFAAYLYECRKYKKTK